MAKSHIGGNGIIPPQSAFVDTNVTFKLEMMSLEVSP